MYGFKDYFEEKYRNEPYRSGREEMEDWLRLLDMVLEGYLGYKGLGREEKLFSRGLVITESEMQSYFDTPPYFRERDVCDPELAAAAGEALAYIENRTGLTLGLWQADDIPDSGEETEEIVLSDRDDEAADNEAFSAAIAAAAGSVSETEYEIPVPDGADPEYDFGEDDEDIGAEEPAVDILWIDSLKNMFSLDKRGVLAAVMALASATDRRYERIFGFLQDDISRKRPTIGLLNALMARITSGDGAGEPEAGLLDDELFTSLFVSSEEERGLDTPLVLNPLLRKLLLGQPYDEAQLPDALSIYREAPDIPLFFTETGAELEYVLTDPDNRFCYIENDDEDTVLHILHCFALALGMPLYVLDLKQLIRTSSKERAACLADLSMRLHLGNGLLSIRYGTEENVEFFDNKEIADRQWKLLERIMRIYGGCLLLFGAKEEPRDLIVKSVPFLRVPEPDVDLRTEIWTYFLKKEDDGPGVAESVAIEDVADCYDISYSMIRNTCRRAKTAARVRRQDVLSRELLLDSLRQLNQVDFSGLASYVPAAYTWEDITITEDQKALLKVACDRYRLRNRVGRGWGLTKRNAYGNGVSLLLYGPPGTGKTMAAQIVANELGIPLYRVDISQIFSKYIGETEKNLSMIFDAAKGSNVILFFDEADALFSKRTEINNSNDKYANSETAYLLQKIEEYDGMSILATNLYTNFDTAFVRRITYAVRLDSPDEAARYTLWTTTLPKTAKLEENLPFRFLAKMFELSGSNIKAILFSASYMAGAEGKAVSTAHIVRAMEYEFRKLGRFIDREAFGPYAQYLTSAIGEKESRQ